MRTIGVVHLLDEDETLARLLTACERAAARRALAATAFGANQGLWRPDAVTTGGICRLACWYSMA